MKDRLHVRMLVIDDDDSVCRKVQTWLAAEAYDVVTFTSAADGLRHALAAPAEIALVDLRLPDSDGVDVIASLARTAPHMRIIAMTAFPETEQVIRAVRAGARDFLPKPIQQPSLVESLDRQLHDMGIASRTEEGFNRRLGARLRELRTAAHRTQTDVAQAADITPAQLSQIELGKSATSTWTLARICGTMKINLSTLFTDL